MSWMNSNGAEMVTPRADANTKEIKARAKAIAMAGLQNQGWSSRQIAAFFGTNQMRVLRMIKRLPDEARSLRGARHYMGSLEPAVASN